MPRDRSYLKGVLSGLAAASIWAGWSVMTRLAVTTNMDAWDIAALRFGVAGPLLVPILLRRGLARDRLGWSGLVVIIAGLGHLCTRGGGSGCSSRPPMTKGRSIQVACRCSWL